MFGRFEGARGRRVVGSMHDDEEEGQRRRVNLPEQCVRLLEGFRRLDGARVRRSVIYV